MSTSKRPTEPASQNILEGFSVLYHYQNVSFKEKRFSTKKKAAGKFILTGANFRTSAARLADERPDALKRPKKSKDQIPSNEIKSLVYEHIHLAHLDESGFDSNQTPKISGKRSKGSQTGKVRAVITES